MRTSARAADILITSSLVNTVRRVRDAAIEWILSDKSIRIDQTAEGMRARIRPHLHWRAAFALLFPIFPFLFAWHLLRHQPSIPYIGQYIPHAASQLIVGAAAVLIAGFSVALAITMLDRVLTRGTIQANPDRLLVSVRGIWRHALELAAADVDEVCAAPDETRSEDRHAGQWQPGLALRITPVEGKALEILNWRCSGNVTKLATAINHGLGISRERRRRAWLARQLENATAPASSGMLSYGAQIEGVALEAWSGPADLPKGLLLISPGMGC